MIILKVEFLRLCPLIEIYFTLICYLHTYILTTINIEEGARKMGHFNYLCSHDNAIVHITVPVSIGMPFYLNKP